MKKLAHLHAKVPTALRDALDVLASQNDRSLSAELRVAIRQHLDQQAPPPQVVTAPSESLRSATLGLGRGSGDGAA